MQGSADGSVASPSAPSTARMLVDPEYVDLDGVKDYEPPGTETDTVAEPSRAPRAWVTVTTYWRAFLYCEFVCMAALLWGYDVQVSGSSLSIPAFRRDFGNAYDGDYVLPARWQSAFNSLSSVGGVFGGLTAGAIASRIGLRGGLALACFTTIGAVFLQFFAPAHGNGVLLAGKLVNGVAIGMFVTLAPHFCAEVSPLPLRGVTTGSVNLWIVIGQLLATCVIRITGSRDDHYAYRIPFAVQWVFPLLLLAGLPFVPESPWYLVRRGQVERARAVLVRVDGPDAEATADAAVAELLATVAAEDEQAGRATYAACFRGTDLRRTVLACMVFVLQQAAGVVFVLGYSTYFFQLAGFDTTKSFQLGLGVSAIGVVGNIAALLVVEHAGRRPLFVWGMVGCTLINFVVAFASLPSTSAARWVMAIFTIIYNFVYQAGIGPVGYVLFAEVSSAKLRSKTVGLGICVNSLCTLVFNTVIPYMVNPDEGNLGGKVGFIFGGLGSAGVVWSYFFIPETRSRTVAEIDQLFEYGVAPRRFGTTDLAGYATDA